MELRRRSQLRLPGDDRVHGLVHPLHRLQQLGPRLHEHEVLGNINVALVWGLLQFVSTFAIAYFYARHASKSLDPLASKLRDEFDLEVGQ